jgi:outer membrane protein OmpA-like peptidoglycan-associated protein
MLKLRLLAAAATLAVVAGCAQRPASLDQAQAALQTARTDPTVATYGAAELDAAQAQLQSADQAWNDGEGSAEAAHRANLALTQVEVAKSAAQSRKDQAEVGELGGDKVLRQAAESQVDQLQRQLASLQAKQTSRGIVLTVGDALFDTGQATLKPGAYNDISRLSQFLRENPARSVRIEGHTDSTGSLTTNMILSERRAEAVADALVADGVDRGRIGATGMGPDYPVATNATAAGRQQNRRVEVVIENAPATGSAAAM